MQISLNLSELEKWIVQVGLPKGIQSHLIPVRDLLNWLQVREFVNLVCFASFMSMESVFVVDH